MKKLWMLVVVGIFLLSACGATDDHGTDIEAHDPWARMALKNENTAIYLSMHNHSGSADELTTASTDIAETTEIHKSETDANGMMQMNLQSSVPLPVGAEISFEPGGLHIMLTGLKQDLQVGDTITVTLHFKTHADLVLSVPVVDAAGPDHSHMDMHASPAP
jgi:periplasmic copper chaperone A